MLKLIKYEFRKNRTGLMIMLLIAAGLFLLAPLGAFLDKEGLIACSFVLLCFYGGAAYVYVLARGISAYSNELKTRTGYLLMMVPRSTMSILFSKLLFTLFFAVALLALSVLALVGVGGIMMREMYGARSLMDMLQLGLTQLGMSLDMFEATALFFVVEVLSSVLAVVSIAYLSATLSATVLQQGRMRGVVDTLIFLALFFGVSWLTDRFSPEMQELFRDMGSALRAASPVLLMDLALTAAFTALSAVLLKRKVAL